MSFDLDHAFKLLHVAEKARAYPNLKKLHDEAIAMLERMAGHGSEEASSAPFPEEKGGEEVIEGGTSLDGKKEVRRL